MEIEKPSSAAFGELIPGFLGILKHFSKLGYAIEDYQRLEIVNDFYVEAWAHITTSYDPAKGELRSYAFAAFSRFARRRIVREARWRQMLDVIDEDQTSASRVSDAELSANEQQRIKMAVAALPDTERRLVALRFSEGIPERTIAEQVKMSRYRVRHGLATALAKVAAMIGESGQMSALDLEISRMLFIEQKPVPLIAQDLSLTEASVRLARRRVLNHLASTLGTTS